MRHRGGRRGPVLLRASIRGGRDVVQIGRSLRSGTRPRARNRSPTRHEPTATRLANMAGPFIMAEQFEHVKRLRKHGLQRREVEAQVGDYSASRMGSPRFAATGSSMRTRSAIAERAIVPQSTRAATEHVPAQKSTCAPPRPAPPPPAFTRRTLCARRVAALDTRLACHSL